MTTDFFTQSGFLLGPQLFILSIFQEVFGAWISPSCFHFSQVCRSQAQIVIAFWVATLMMQFCPEFWRIYCYHHFKETKMAMQINWLLAKCPRFPLPCLLEGKAWRSNLSMRKPKKSSEVGTSQLVLQYYVYKITWTYLYVYIISNHNFTNGTYP